MNLIYRKCAAAYDPQELLPSLPTFPPIISLPQTPTMARVAGASFLTIPSELRNAIYLYVFQPEPTHELSSYNDPRDPIAVALKPHYDNDISTPEPCAPHHLRVLATCKQIHHEAHLLALSLTGFHIVGETAHPNSFAARCASMPEGKVGAIRHLTLTARISHLRAMNETWGGLPFGNPCLELDTLTIVPKRPDASWSAYAEIADLSQSHTLAYIFAETFKRLRNVRVVCVKNRACFNEVVWRLVYRSLVYRIWRWGGGRCGIKFLASDEEEEQGKEWFKIFLKDTGEGRECGEEVVRLVGGSGELPDPDLAGI